ncbi:MAG: polysaccharide pyruvyl transferase family protein [Firmicutes bacterium]|nr:polysaccharide pyruvyl transferase family protein [Bacillota bacterium]
MAKVCISGYYGYDRVENELMLMSMVGALRHQDENTEIVVFSANASQTEADLDVVATGRDFETVRKELRGADLLIVGGGHLLKETADLADIKYYLRIIKAAQHMDVPVFLYHQTLEPFANSRTKTMVGKVLQKVRKISVADQASVEVLHEMGIRRGRIHLMADPILALKDVEETWNVAEMAVVDKKAPQAAIEAAEAEKAKEAEKNINYDGMDVEIEIRIVEKEEPEVNPEHTIVITDLAEAEIPTEVPAEEVAAVEEEVKPAKPVTNRPENLATVVPSFWKKPGEKFAAFAVAPKTELPALQIAAMADHMVENGYQVVFLPLCCETDAVIAKEIMAMMQQPAYIVDGKISAASYYTAINTVDFVFSTELTVLMLAALCKKPFTALCCCEKTVEWMVAMGLTPTGNLMDYNEEAFVYNFKAAVADPAAVVAAIEEHLPAMQEEAAWAESQLALIFDQIERKKARTTKGYAARREAPAKLAVDQLPVAEVPAEEPVKEELPEEKEEIEDLMETMETMETIEEEPIEAEEQGYVRRSRQGGKSGKGDSLAAAKDKAKDIFGGIGGKLKSLSSKVEKPSRRRPAKEELPEEDILDEVTEEKEA